jgi:hypothetical protein
MTRTLHHYQVYCGNIGLVHDGSNKREAMAAFAAYKKSSKLSYGRGAGEHVTLFVDCEPIREYCGHHDEDAEVIYEKGERIGEIFKSKKG